MHVSIKQAKGILFQNGRLPLGFTIAFSIYLMYVSMTKNDELFLLET